MTQQIPALELTEDLIEQCELKITAARIILQYKTPFFYFLVAWLKPKAVKNGTKLGAERPPFHTMAVDARGTLYYVPEFVLQLTDKELAAIVTHEVIHLAFNHTIRAGGREPNLWNIAIDIVDNYMIQQFPQITLPKQMNIESMDEKGQKTSTTANFYIPSGDEIDIDLGGKPFKVTNIGNKTSEEIYTELLQEVIKNQDKNSGAPQYNPITIHLFGDQEGDDQDEDNDGNGQGNGFSKEELEQLSEEWKQRLSTAVTQAQSSRGDLPSNLQREFDDLMNPKAPWYVLLYKYIEALTPKDYTWMRFSKKSIAARTILPGILKEGIEIVTHVDTSGSMSADMITECISEIKGICQSFPELKLTFINGDTDIHIVQEFDGVDPRSVIEKLKLEGGGGTSHIPVAKWLKEHKPKAKVIVCLTDGYTAFPQQKDTFCDWLWCVPQHGADTESFPFGDVIQLNDKHRRG